MTRAAHQRRSCAWECVVPAAVALGVVLCLPLVGFVAFALRPVVLLGAVGVIIAIIVWCVRDIRECSRTEAAGGEAYRGLRLAEDVALDAGHCWAWLDDEAVVGADDFVLSALGIVEAIDLPAPGDHVERGDTLLRLHHLDRSLELPSPVTGRVVAINDALRDHPELVNTSPFGHGWAVRIRADRLGAERRELLIGRRASGWFRREVDFLFRLLIPNGSARDETVAPEDIHLRIDHPAWCVLCRTLDARRPAIYAGGAP